MSVPGTRVSPIRVFLVDDHPSILNGLKACLEAPAFDVVGTARTGKEAISRILSCEVDVVVLDVRLPDLSGAEVLKRVKAGAPHVAVLMFTAFPEPDALLDAVLHGAAGFLLKDAEGHEVAALVRRIVDGENALAPEVWKPMMAKFLAAALARRGAAADGMDPTDLLILSAMARGLSNHEIAAGLSMCYDSVRTRIRRIFVRLDTSDRTQAVVKSIAKGLITPSDVEG